MEKIGLDFKGGNPGAVQYGNFINYYQFHPPENRLMFLPKDIWDNKTENFHGLDIGCNSGDLTRTMCNYLETNTNAGQCKFLGIDIDPILIERAKERQKCEKVEFQCIDFMDQAQRHSINDYLREYNMKKFNVVSCFSITMWIHLNHGDDGLKKFLEDVTKLGEFIIIEPQPWKCYKSALKRLKINRKKSFPLFADLKIRNDVETFINNYLIEQCHVEKVYESERTKWGRKLLVFK